MLKLTSLSTVIASAAETYMRFPLVLVSAITGTVALVFQFHLVGFEETNTISQFLVKLIMTTSLGLVLHLSLALYSESKEHKTGLKFIIQLAGFVLLLIYYFTFAQTGFNETSNIIRYFLFSIGLHMLVAFAPFIRNFGINAFWQFNKVLFIRFLKSYLYSIVLYAGISIALILINFLLDVNINEKLYLYLYFCIIGIFNTWFFLAGVPKDFKSLEMDKSYPGGLKAFTQFVLLPLVTVYLVILYLYMAKIIIEWSLPEGYVSILIIIFSILGILSLLLIYPVRNEKGNAWINQFARWYYFALYPLIVLLFLAIGKRVTDYGITENRYFVIILAMWLLVIATYFLISKTKNIKWIPISLCVLAFMTSIGPWSAISVSKTSQISRLESKLTKSGILQNGKVIPATQDLGSETRTEISSIVSYISQNHGLHELQYLFEVDLDSVFESENAEKYEQTRIVMSLLGTGWKSEMEASTSEMEEVITTNYFDYRLIDRPAAIKVSDYDYYQSFSHSIYSDKSLTEIETEMGLVNLEYIIDNGSIKVLINENLAFSYPLIDFVSDLRKDYTEYKYYDMNMDQMTIMFSASNINIKIVFDRIRGRENSNKNLIISELRGWVLLGISNK